MTAGSAVCRSNCALLIKLLLQLLVLVLHVLSETASMMFDLAGCSLFDIKHFALMLWLDVPITRCRVRHALHAVRALSKST